MSYMGPFVIRTFDIGKGQATKDRELATGSPILLVLVSATDEPRDWLKAGMSLAKILLMARAENLWCSFLNQPIEVGSLRVRVKTILNEEHLPQLLMRVGYAKRCETDPKETC